MQQQRKSTSFQSPHRIVSLGLCFLAPGEEQV